MSQFNRLERWGARALSRNPRAKAWIKTVYSRCVYVLARKTVRFEADNPIEPIVPDDRTAHFFGYYDKSPVNEAGLTLVTTVDADTRKTPDVTRAAMVSVVSAAGGVLLRVPTKAYNWQQGARATWLSDDLFIFNDYDQDALAYVARVYSVEKRSEVRCFDRPAQDACTTEFFLSINYRRLAALRPDYGYHELSPLADDELRELQDDGVWRVDYRTGKTTVLVSLQDAVASVAGVEEKGTRHLFNHVMISPDGGSFVFLHRMFTGDRRTDRLLWADAKTGHITVLADYGMVSHCFWVDNETILGYMRGPGFVDAYWQVDLETGSFTKIGGEKLATYGDGHPHVHGEWFVTDTYPDKSRMQHLLLCNRNTGDVREIASLFHGFEYSGQSRCDLHPRLSPDGQYVYFDSVFTGQRQLYRMKVPE